MLHRLATRAGNTFGQSSAQRAQVLADLANVEPVLRRSAHVIIETTLPLADVVDLILQCGERDVGPHRRRVVPATRHSRRARSPNVTADAFPGRLGEVRLGIRLRTPFTSCR